MTTAAEMYRRMEQVNVDKLCSQALTGASDMMADLNREQMRQGKDSKGGDLYMYRSQWYSAWKQSLSSYMATPGIADFYVTGAFQRAMYADVQGDVVQFWSNDGKTEDLLAMSPDMFGLTDESKAKLNEMYLREALTYTFRETMKV